MAKGKYADWLSENGLIRLRGWATDGLSDDQIAVNIGISRSTLSEWKKKYPDISDALKKGKDVADREIENALRKRAKGYFTEEITYELIEDTGQKKRHDKVQPFTEHDWVFAKQYFGQTCAYCGREVDLTKDHLDPLDNGGELVKTNVVPACQRCNSSKKDRNWLSWFQKQQWYDKYRAHKIQDYINLMLAMDATEDEPKLVVTRKVRKEVPPDTGAIALWLKNRKPEEWFKASPADANLKSANARKANAEADIAEAEAKEIKEKDTTGKKIIVLNRWGNETDDDTNN